MSFCSILFAQPSHRSVGETAEAPAFFVDLNLDQVVESITAGFQAYNLERFYFTPLTDLGEIEYRHGVIQDLEDKTLLGHIRDFAKQMQAMREHLEQAGKLRFPYQKQRWFLDAVGVYCDAVSALSRNLSELELRSNGFQGFCDFMQSYCASERFTTLRAEMEQLKAALAAIRYCLQIKGSTIRVRRYEDETDYSAEVEATFEKFKQGAVKDYLATFPGWPSMNHVEEGILGYVAELFPETFASLEQFCTKHAGYLDPTIADFDREVQFYVAYLDYMARFRRWALHFCYPRMSDSSKAIGVHDTFDVALAQKLVNANTPVICNDFYLAGDERIIVVSGPNQGGKTTFARTFGQVHYLASLGLPVPGRDARLYLFDQILTHFEQEEDIANLRGKLQDDLIRVHEVLSQATPRSIIIMNEIFTSTTIEDAIFLGKEVMEWIAALDCLCVCVTFIDELATLDKTVSMVSTVVPDNPDQRTFKVVRKPADGLSYALTVAEKYGLTYRRLRERLAA